MSSLAVIGGIAHDETIVGSRPPVSSLGGSGTYAAIAASYYLPTSLIGIVGEDFQYAKWIASVARKLGISLDISIQPGTTTRFKCSYTVDMRSRTTQHFDVGVGAHLAKVSDGVRAESCLIASNDPRAQIDIWGSSSASWMGVDSIDYWIEAQRCSVRRIVQKSNVAFFDARELLLLTNQQSITEAADVILDDGPTVVCVKYGEGGSTIYTKDWTIFAPIFETNTVDPTGAGDSYAGAFIAILARGEDAPIDFDTLASAVSGATSAASVAVESFGPSSLSRTSNRQLEARARLVRSRLKVGLR